jgi:EmrB/QacA subfamily drug resistance transporter
VKLVTAPSPLASVIENTDRRRWLALVILCLGQLMIVLDTTIVNVALPAIQADLHFSNANLTWVIDAYMITFGSFLLLAGRMGDLVGRKRMFLTGLVVFTLASMLCGVAQTEAMLLVGRFVQGFGGALASAVILAIIVTEFPGKSEQARAMGVFAFVATAGGSIGLIAGGILTQSINWHWIFFINAPIGLFALFAGRALIEENEGPGLGEGVDVVGSVLVTVATMIGVYAIVTASSHGWGSAHTLGFGALSVALLAVFGVLESRIANPVLPPRIWHHRMLIGSSVVRGLLVTGMFAMFFVGVLYVERVLGYDATTTGLAYLPMTMTVGLLSLLVTPRLLARFGARQLLVSGMALVAASLLAMSRVTPTTHYAPELLAAFLVLAVGMSRSFMPLLTIAMGDVPKQDAGLGSGVVNVSMQLAGAIGLAVLGTIAADRSKTLVAAHDALKPALVGGYQLAFQVAAACVVAGMLIALAVLRSPRPVEVDQPVAQITDDYEVQAA